MANRSLSGGVGAALVHGTFSDIRAEAIAVAEEETVLAERTIKHWMQRVAMAACAYGTPKALVAAKTALQHPIDTMGIVRFHSPTPSTNGAYGRLRDRLRSTQEPPHAGQGS